MLSLVADSSCDLPQEIIDRYGIRLVPLKIMIGGKEYTEGVDLSAEEFVREMNAADELPKTSQPSPEDFSRVFEELSAGDNEVLCLTISSKLSGTYQSASLGKEILASPKVTVFDTLAGSLGHGLQIIKAAEMAVKGFSVAKIVEELKRYRERMNILILLDTLENIVKGGRLSRFKGSLAEILNIKMLLEGIDGEVRLVDKVRGRKRFLWHVLELIGKRLNGSRNLAFGITHVNNLGDVEFLAQEIKKRYYPKGIIVNNMGATMGTYAGNGGIIISF
ncbi:MAG: DegV family protein [Dethiobacteria bacterium]|jgi:DegV family protein with EDD domain|nr:DegV family protein [Bacillota bacterium]